jgi:hypothetical protein
MYVFSFLASQQAHRISALVRYDAVGAEEEEKEEEEEEEEEEAAMQRTRTRLPLPLLSLLTVASWRLLTATAVTGLGSGITLKLVSVSKETYLQVKRPILVGIPGLRDHTQTRPNSSGPATAQRARLCEARVSDAEVRTSVNTGLM